LSEGEANRAADITLQDDRQTFEQGENALERTFEGGQTDKEIASREAIAAAGYTTQLTIADGLRDSHSQDLAWDAMKWGLESETSLTTENRTLFRGYVTDYLTELKSIEDSDLTDPQKENRRTLARTSLIASSSLLGVDVILNQEVDDNGGLNIDLDFTSDGSNPTPYTNILNQNAGNVVNTLNGDAPIAGLANNYNGSPLTPSAALATTRSAVEAWRAGGPGTTVLNTMMQLGNQDAQASLWAQATGQSKADALNVLRGVDAVRPTVAAAQNGDNGPLIAALSQWGSNPSERAMLYSLVTGMPQGDAERILNTFNTANPGLLGTA